MRDIKLRLKIVWLLLTDQYTKSQKERTWWLQVGTTIDDTSGEIIPKKAIKIMFGGGK